ncbi:hypothetical protein FGK60_32530 [Streptomyces sp. DASNCL29]|nr:hypothetical protein FGK60_32530 [Streptomyces sp. DASNCL29]
MAPMVVERRARREDFSEPCTVTDRTFFTHRDGSAPAVHLYVTIPCLVIAAAFLAKHQARLP